MNANGPQQVPDLRGLLNAHLSEVFSAFNAHQIGTIVSFDAERQTATVSLNLRRVVYDKPQPTGGELQQDPRIVDYPPLTDVPVFFPSGGNARLTLPIAAGDTCLVLFNDRDFDAWFATGNVAQPNSARMHSLSDGLAIVGFRSLANKVSNYSATDAELRFGNAVVKIDPDGNVTIAAQGDAVATISADGSIELAGGNGGTVTIDAFGSIVAEAEGGATVTLNVDGTVTLDAAAGSRLRLEDKVSLDGATGGLKTALDAVVTALTALDAKTGPSAAAQIAAASTAINNFAQ